MITLKEQAITLKSEMAKITEDLVAAVQNGKTLKVKRLSAKLNDCATVLAKVEKEIKSLETEANTVTINDGEYTITTINNKYLTLSKNNGTLTLKYIHSDNNLTPLGDVYSGYTRSNGLVYGKEIQVKYNHWTALRGKLSKDISIEISAAEDVLVNHFSLYGGIHQVN